MKDYMIRATAAQGQIRAFAVTSKELTECARVAHSTSPVVTAALGRTLSAAVMMGSMMKSEKDVLTIHIEGTGPMRGLNVTADSLGNVKGYPFESQVDLPANALGKLDVGGAIGQGGLVVIKDLGLKDPYVGQVALQTGEIAEDLTYYFATSEQVPSSVGLGVLVDTDCSVRQAGGFIIQLMPDVTDEVISSLEEKLSALKSVTTMLEEGMTPEDILNALLGDLDMEILDKREVGFHCDCSIEKVGKAIASIDKKDIQSMIDDNEPIEVRCQFCNKKYVFDVDMLKEML
ncbi:MAG: Hsp33 family molecular chaperone HslO [Lachnospiraceae bacterium]|nr:Hsp33 family molecular chaperone HslO [Lachnospiraceae bacterium]